MTTAVSAPGSEAPTHSHVRDDVDSSCAILDSGQDKLTPLQLWSKLLDRYHILEECQKVYENPAATDPEQAMACKDEAWHLAEAIHDLHRLANQEIRKQLIDFVSRDDGGAVCMNVCHAPDLLNSFDVEFWTHTLTCLFYRDDCHETYERHGRRNLRGRQWAEQLINRVDFRGWALFKEFAAMAANIDVRRRQMYGVFRHVNSQNFQRDVAEIHGIDSLDVVKAALAAGECYSIRDALRKKNIDTKVKTVLRHMKLALRDVEGSEGEREVLWMKMLALRIWNGCSILFFTLNPHDFGDPLLVVFSNGESWHREKVQYLSCKKLSCRRCCNRMNHVLCISLRAKFRRSSTLVTRRRAFS